MKHKNHKEGKNCPECMMKKMDKEMPKELKKEMKKHIGKGRDN